MAAVRCRRYSMPSGDGPLQGAVLFNLADDFLSLLLSVDSVSRQILAESKPAATVGLRGHPMAGNGSPSGRRSRPCSARPRKVSRSRTWRRQADGGHQGRGPRSFQADHRRLEVGVAARLPRPPAFLHLALASEGVDQRVIDEIVGHQSEEQRKRYRHLYPRVMVMRSAGCSAETSQGCPGFGRGWSRIGAASRLRTRTAGLPSSNLEDELQEAISSVNS